MEPGPFAQAVETHAFSTGDPGFNLWCVSQDSSHPYSTQTINCMRDQSIACSKEMGHVGLREEEAKVKGQSRV